jgi:hypothetical protein
MQAGLFGVCRVGLFASPVILRWGGRVGDPVTFLAAFPSILAAIKVGTDGMRITLDVPESEMAQAVRLLTMRDAVLKVTVEVLPEQSIGKQERKASRDFTILDT